MISAYATIGGKRYHLGTEAVLSRWNVQGCANCQTHLETKAFIGVQGFREESIKDNVFDVEVRTRDGLLTASQPLALAAFERKPFQFEVL